MILLPQLFLGLSLAIHEPISRLGSPDFRTREAASRKLTAIGEPALPYLYAAKEKNSDPEVRRRAEGVIQAIEDKVYGKPWRWSKEKASLAYCITHHLQDYEVERVRKNEYYTPLNIRTKKDRKVVYSIQKGHQAIVFTRWKDTLYIAEYSPIASGCEVVALDLKTGKQLWKTRLQGIGEVAHSKYSNFVNIETDGRRVIISGNEAHGRYIEHLDRQTGKTIANKKLDADPQSFRQVREG
jgi:hypothetical protein